MENLLILLESTMNLFKIEFDLWGYRVNLFNVFFFVGVTDIVGWIIARVLNDD